MRKKLAKKYFTEIYEATFDDAITYILGKTGNPNILSKVLFYTYSELFIFLKKQRLYIEEQTSDFFYDCLNDMLSEFTPAESTPSRTIEPATAEQVDALLDIDIDVTDESAIDNLLVKKSHSFLLQKNALERKVFVLYFYKGFDVRRISGLLGVNPDIVCGCICTLLEEIKTNFLANYIKQ